MIINYTLKRSKRKSIAISVEQGKVTVKAPMRARSDLIEQFVFSKSDWIQQAMDKSMEHIKRFEPLINLHYALLNGKLIEIDFENNINTKLKEGIIFINRKYFGNKDAIFLQITKLYKKLATEQLLHRFKELANHFGFVYSSIELTSAKKKWGSCDTRKRIKLNFRLLMLPQPMQDYVIIHELCHLVEHNHSPKFWNNVAKYIPNYKQVRKELKGYSILNTLY